MKMMCEVNTSDILTMREKLVLIELMRGKTIKDLAKQYQTSVVRIEQMRQNIITKLDLPIENKEEA